MVAARLISPTRSRNLRICGLFETNLELGATGDAARHSLYVPNLGNGSNSNREGREFLVRTMTSDIYFGRAAT